MKFDHDKFLFCYSNGYGKLNASQSAGICNLLDFIAADDAITDLRWIAYMLATTRHETAKTMQPIAEYGKGKGYKYGIPDSQTGKTYYGRGFVQLTWKDNYAAMGKVLGMDFVNNPDLVMLPDVAYKIMSYGMRKGAFTGVGLSKYINGDKCDYINARRIINGTDKSELIAGYAEAIETMLRDCEVK